MKRVILALVIVGVVAVVAYKLAGRRQQTAQQPLPPAAASPPASSAPTQAKTIFYLFHNPADQDEECRQIYAFADRVEHELGERAEVKRPDVAAEKNVLEKFHVKVLPTVLIVGADGEVTDRFEGEGEQVASRIEQAIVRLKEPTR